MKQDKQRLGRQPPGKKGFLSIVTAALLMIILWYGFQVFQDYQKYKGSSRQYEELKQEAVRHRDGTQQTGQKDFAYAENNAKADGTASEKTAPVAVDFQTLVRNEEGEDVRGWLYVEALDISYPVMQGDENDYFLHRTIDGDYEYAGSIFMDAGNSPDFTDRNTILFGHNMADGSMFGRLKEFSLSDAAQASPYIWIVTEGQNYCYQVMSARVADVTNECYTLFEQENDTDYVAFLERMRLNSEIDTGSWKFSGADRVLTLSTCNGDENSTDRYVVQAIRIG